MNYHRIAQILKPLENVECWNYSNKVTATLPAGMFIWIAHAYDSYHTNIQAATSASLKEAKTNTPNDPRISRAPIPTSNGKAGYRFIVPNLALAEATRLNFAPVTRDFIGELLGDPPVKIPKPTKVPEIQI